MKKHRIKPVMVGIRNETAVHLRLPDSFLMVMQAVPQGQCINEKSMVQTAVSQVQPLDTSNSLS